MKMRTAVFAWTKKFQRRAEHASDLMRTGQRELATKLLASVKKDHLKRVKRLCGVA